MEETSGKSLGKTYEPNTEMPIPTGKFGAANANEFFLPAGDEIKYASLRVTFKDGTQSEVVRIDRE